MGRLFHFKILVLIMGLFQGCALNAQYADKIRLSYKPTVNTSKIDGSAQIKVRNEVIDLRPVKDKVSCKKTGFGTEMAPIVAENDIPDLLAKSMDIELLNRGFDLSNGNLVVRYELARCYNDFKVGFWSARAVAEAAMHVKLLAPDGRILFAKMIAGQFTHEPIQLTTGSNAGIALNGAIRDAIQKLVNDPEFINALLLGGR